MAAHPHRPSVTEGMWWQLGPSHKTETPRTRMSGWEVPHAREKPEQATGCGGGWGRGWAPRKPRLVTQPTVLLGCNVCCHQKQIPQAGLSPCGGGIISRMKWQRREAMCSCPSREACARVSQAEQSSTSTQNGGLWWPHGGERPPHCASQFSLSLSCPGVGGHQGGTAPVEKARG